MPETMTDAPNIANAPTIYICTTCRPPGEPDSTVRPGAILATVTAQAAAGTEVDVRPMRCLGNCSRGVSAALQRLVALSVRRSRCDVRRGFDRRRAPARPRRRRHSSLARAPRTAQARHDRAHPASRISGD